MLHNVSSIEAKVQMMIDKRMSASLIVNSIKEELLLAPMAALTMTQSIIERLQTLACKDNKHKALQNKLAVIANDLNDIQNICVCSTLTDEQRQQFDDVRKAIVALEDKWKCCVDVVVIDLIDELCMTMFDDTEVVKHDATKYAVVAYRAECLLNIIDKVEHAKSAECLQLIIELIAPLTQIQQASLQHIVDKLD
jgi:hypothetical protein